MIDGGTYHIEIAERLATLYIVGNITRASQRLLAASSALPGSVEVLCINLDGVDQLGDSGLATIDALRNHWESTRRGSFRIAFALPRPRRAREGPIQQRA